MTNELDAITRAICDGYNNGYQKLEDCNAMDRMRFDAAARSAIKAWNTRTPPDAGAGQGTPERAGVVFDLLEGICSKLTDKKLKFDLQSCFARGTGGVDLDAVQIIADRLNATPPARLPDREAIAAQIREHVDYLLYDTEGPYKAADAILALSTPAPEAVGQRPECTCPECVDAATAPAQADQWRGMDSAPKDKALETDQPEGKDARKIT